MFVRDQIVKRGSAQYRYLKVVESVRKGAGIRQKTLVNLGNVAGWPDGKLNEALKLLADFVGLDISELADVQFSDCRQLGQALVLSHIWEQLHLDRIIEQALAGRRVEIDVAAYVRTMVLNRLIAPCSKKAVWEWVGRDVLLPGIQESSLVLHGYYRSLEYLSSAKVAIEKHLHSQVKDLFNQDLSLVLYDLTSTYFEGKGCDKAKHGYSRDHRPDLVQIEIGLLVDAEGIPIGHQVFDGNVKDLATVLPTLKRLTEDFKISRCIFVSDDGMASEENLNALTNAGYEYITSLSLGNSIVGSELIASMPAKAQFKRLTDNLAILTLRKDGNLRYIATYNHDRARASRRHRRKRLQACIESLQHLQQPPKLRSRRRTPEQVCQVADRFLRRKASRDFFVLGSDAAGKLEWRLNLNALRREWRKDGFLILKTNAPALSDVEVAQAYRTLWRVENAFRHIKDVVDLRPIRHWKDPRVLGHVFVCVLAYTIERLMDKRLEAANLNMTAISALTEMDSLTVATLDVGDQTVRRRSRITPKQAQILAAVGVGQVPELW
jgi:transposase